MKVILLPGMDGTGILFEPLLKMLPRDIDAQIIDYPCNKEKGYKELTDYVKEKLPYNEEFVLVAESFSGPIGYTIASDPPENLKAVVFVSTFISAPNRFIGVLSKLPLTLFLKLPLPSLFIKAAILGKDVESHTIKLFRESLKKVSSRMLAFRIREMAKLQCGVKKILAPCAYIVAKHDKLVSSRHIDEFKKVAPGIEIVKIPGPHFILQTNPQDCAKVVEKYVTL